MTQVPRSALVLSATFMATASTAIFLSQFQWDKNPFFSFSSSSPSFIPSVATSDSEKRNSPGSSSSSSNSRGGHHHDWSHDHHSHHDHHQYHHHHHHHHHHKSALHGPVTLQESLSIMSRNEFYDWVREWVVLFIAFLFLYTISYSMLEWLRWKVRPRGRGGPRGGGGVVSSSSRSRSTSRIWTRTRRGGALLSFSSSSTSSSSSSSLLLSPSLTVIEQELSDYTRKRRRISSAAGAIRPGESRFHPANVWSSHHHHHRHRREEEAEEEEDQDELTSVPTGVDQLVIMVICAIGLAVAQGSFLMLPITILVHAVFAAFGMGQELDRLYLEWLAPSLLHRSAAKIALLTDLAMFLLVPFAFFYYEQEPLRRRFWPKCRSALVAVILIDVLYVAGVWAVQHLVLVVPSSPPLHPINNNSNNNISGGSHGRGGEGLEGMMSPIAVMRVSRIVLGWAGFMVTVPMGVVQLFRLAARLPVRMGSRQYAKARLAQLECEHAVWVAKLEDKDRQVARERASMALLSSSPLSTNRNSPFESPSLSHQQQQQQQQQNRRKRSFAMAGPAAEDQANPFRGGQQEMSRYDILGKLRLLEYETARLRKELYVSPWKRNAAFFGLLAISLAIYGRLLVLLAKSLIFGHPGSSTPASTPSSSPPSSPFPSSLPPTTTTIMTANSAVIAAPSLDPSSPSSLQGMPWAMTMLTGTPSATRLLWEAGVDIFWIFMVMALALYGLYHHPYYRKLRPRHGRTSPLAMMANIPIVLTLATASWSLMVDCLGILQSPSVWAVRGQGGGRTGGESMMATPTTTTTTTTGFLPLSGPEEDPTRQLLWDTEVFDQVLGEKRAMLESLVRTVMFVLLSMLGAQWIVHRLIGLQNRR
ncbi:hypothetical protein DFQ27_000392 [Actinomortierella ambigua]|uniref:Uncharacterized protein n=1 Tax=Actinomortierella ambigua TaxID=1343610 RepID=A0A9P6UA39_9FUNG|nr:hypothetical protein DFQ27_000392 [Actinomortierella ambigua]